MDNAPAARTNIFTQAVEQNQMKTRMMYFPVLAFVLCTANSWVLADEDKPKKYEFKVEDVKAQPAMTVRFKVSAEPDKISAKYAEVFTAVFTHVFSNGGQPAGAPFGRYHAMKEGQFEIEAGVPVAKVIDAKGEIKASELPAGKVATTVHFGPYVKLGEAHEALTKWASDNGYEPTAGLWETYLTDPGQEPDQSKWQTKLFLPVAKKDADKKE